MNTENGKKPGASKRRLAAGIAGAVLAVALIAAACVLFGGRFFAKRDFARLAGDEAARWFGADVYRVESVARELTDGLYHVHLIKEGSPDASFSMIYKPSGELAYDDYFDRVASGGNTRLRMTREYSALVSDALADVPGGVSGGGGIVFADDGEDRGFTGLSPDAVALDQTFDYAELGREYGEVSVRVEDSDLSAERLAQALLQVRSCLDAHGVAFRVIDLVLVDAAHVPSGGEGTGYDGVCVTDFPYADIVSDGLAERAAQVMQP